MSREWGIHCKTCDAHSGAEFNHGGRILRSMVAAYPHIKAAQEADVSGFLEVSITGHGYLSSEFFAWLEGHHEHDLELVDEYDNREPLEEHPV